MTRTVHALYSRYGAEGVTPDLTPDEARSLAKALMGEPAYFDHEHVDHHVLAADVRRLYEISTPEQ